MTHQSLLVFTLLAAVFLAGASIGQLLLRVRLARLERINLRLDQRRLNTLAKAWRARMPAPADADATFHANVREEIDSILSELERR